MNQKNRPTFVDRDEVAGENSVVPPILNSETRQ